MGKPVVLAEGPAKIIAKGDLFHVDCGIAEAPFVAYTPHDLLATIALARAAYDGWAKGGATVRRAKRAGHQAASRGE